MKGFLAGIGLGTAIGLAIAPDTGSETRKKFTTWGASLAQRFHRQMNSAGNGENPQEQAANTGAESGSTEHGNESPSTQDPVAEILNSASKTKLRSVPGIGDATALRIIENRPFENEAEVVETKVIPEKVLKNLKDKLVDGDEEVA